LSFFGIIYSFVLSIASEASNTCPKDWKVFLVAEILPGGTDIQVLPRPVTVCVLLMLAILGEQFIVNTYHAATDL
jgi:hypothetical protein